MNQFSPVDHWRLLTGRFHCIPTLINFSKLPDSFEPADMEKLYRSGPVSSVERSVLQFLLHVWNYEHFPFELSLTANWDLSPGDGRRAFTDWFTGQATGEPGHDF